VVGISLLTLVPGVLGGSERYARELVRGLARVGELEYRVLTPSIAPDAADGLPNRTIHSYRASRSTVGRIGAMSLALTAPGRIRREAGAEELGCVHYALTTTVPPLGPPAVVTLQDLQHELFPQFFSRAERVYRRLLYHGAARRSRLLIVPTEHTKETVIERLGVDTARIRVIPYGVDHERFRPSAGARQEFILYPANRWPHKNHARLLEAFALLRLERPELRLVLTGSGHDSDGPPGVEVRGYVSDDELTELYATASALVFPSLYEGFGLPPLEAMASGCPVAAAQAGSLPEVCGAAARYFDPTSPAEIAHAVLDVLASPDEWSARGVHRAAEFTWDRAARAHEAVYRELTSEGG
jgi:glycosyltransferase involved in cell wall biosynthesis